MKYVVQIECESKEDAEIITNATKNYLIVTQLYNEIFRPVIKYSEDAELVAAYETVWQKVNEYIEGKE